ncbi:MAG: S8 family serine peptidase [Verrucomicrobia bacterium]|nr:S8 family serine peptidase [Verrucomicrobiota bacterium]
MKPRAWFLLSLGMFLAAAVLWRMGEARRAVTAPPPPAKTNAVQNNFWRVPGVRHSLAQASASALPLATLSDPRFPLRLQNAPAPAGGWFRHETAVLLKNAFVDTAVNAPLAIPAHLRAAADPGSYIVQARGKTDADFRAQLKNVGAEIVAYVPNNAYLVRASGPQAARLAAMPRTQSVLPFEPYYKLDDHLLELAAGQKPLPEGKWINIVAFPGEREAVLKKLAALGAVVQQEQRTPFGLMLTVRPRPGSLVALAQSAAVQGIEVHYEKKAANDLQSARIGVKVPTTNTTPYLNLYGEGVIVGVNDTGVEENHPALQGRVINVPGHPFRTTDINGHGTHVAGIIAGNGGGRTPTSVQGSVTGVQFVGKAPQATIFPINSLLASDDTLQQDNLTTNVHISNNSWSYNTPVYTFASAIWDAAVRDSDHRTNAPGDQPILYVFAAGNSGNGDAGGSGALPDTIEAPANGKNVLTVGAIEQNRGITNVVQYTNVVTNVFIDVDVTGVPPNLVTNFTTNLIAVTNIFTIRFLDETDSRDQVASYSSRGNVGLGVEGDYGRFKPDVVAPGSFVVSCAFSNWINLTNNTNNLRYYVSSILDAGLLPDYRFESGTSMAAPAVSGMLALMEEFFAKRLSITNTSPALNKALVINGARSLGVNGYDFSPQHSVNDQGWGLVNISNSIPIGMSLDPANSNSWPIILVEQNPTNVLATGDSHQWQLDIIPAAGATNAASATNAGLRCTLVWTDPPGNPLAGTKLVNDLDLVVFDEAATNYYFGNNIPSGEILTAPVSAEYLFGSNNIPSPPPHVVNPDFPGLSNAVPADFVNNVENVFLPAPLSPRYFISVVGRRVNVNAVTTNNTGVVQDYALVIASANSGLTNGQVFTLTPPTNVLAFTNRQPTQLTNGLTLLRQRVGANYQLTNPNNWQASNGLPATVGGGTLNNTNGVTNQWQFYIFTNVTFSNQYVTNVAGTNVAFIISHPVSLSTPRNTSPDLDVYVSISSNLLSLDPTVMGDATRTFRAAHRDGKEFLLITNGIIPNFRIALGDVFYVGVKSEDQRAAEFNFTVISTDSFGTETNGGFLMTGYPVPAYIPDGSAEQPNGVEMFFICPQPITIGTPIITNNGVITLGPPVAMTNILTHGDIGDLVMVLTSPDGRDVYLHNHSLNNGTNSGADIVLAHDDTRPETVVDGPGSLIDYLGAEGVGLWTLTVYDNGPYGTGLVSNAELFVGRETPSDNGTRRITIDAGVTFFDFAIIPPYATNLTIDLGNFEPPNATVDLFVRRNALPSHNKPPDDVSLFNVGDSDHFGNPPRLPVVIDYSDQRPTGPPPLAPGIYFIAISNSFGASVSVNYTKLIFYGLDPAEVTAHASGNVAVPIADEGLTEHTITVTDDRTIVDVAVNVAINHPRVSDLRITLRDPSLNRVLLFENRGGVADNVSSTNLFANFTEDTTLTTAPLPYLAPIKFAPVPFMDILSPPQLLSSNPYDQGGDEYATGIAIAGRGIYLSGNTRSNAAPVQDGLALAYLLPLTNFTVGIIPPVGASPWWATNWPGSLANRGGDVTFNGLAATTEGVYFVGNGQINLPTLRSAGGDATPDTNFFDAGCSSGTITINYQFFTVRDQLTVYYGGVQLTNTGLINGRGTISVPYSGTSNVLEIVVNETTNQNSTAWNYNVVSDCPSSPSSVNKAIMVKYDPNGPLGVGAGNGALWFTRVFNATNTDPYGFALGVETALGATATDEGNPFVYVVGAAEYTAGREGFVIAKRNASGNSVWRRTDVAVQANNGNSRATAVTAFANSLIFAAGYTNHGGGPDWPVLWNYDIFGASNFSVQSSSPGRYYGVAVAGANLVTVGTTDGTGVNGDSLIEMWDVSGNLLWSVPPLDFGAHDELRGVVALGNRLYAAGSSGQDAMLLEFDVLNGELLSRQVFGAVGDVPRGISTDGNDLFVAGESAANGSGQDSMLWKFKVKNYYQPEESLALFRAGSSLGDWTLEIADTRAGPGTNTSPAELIGWRLDFIYADPLVLPTFVTSFSQNYTYPLANNAVNYYAVELPAGVDIHMVSIQASQPVKVLFNATKIPLSQTAGNTLLATELTNSVFTFTTNGTLVAVDNGTAGETRQRYYLAVQNAMNYEEANTVTLTLAPAGTNVIAELTNGAALAGTLTNGVRMNHYSYAVSSNASGAVFELLNLDGDANLYLRKAVSGPQALPGGDAFDYRSLNPGARDEMIFLVTNAAPVPLTAGRWHLGVANADTHAVSYSVRATELAGQPIAEIVLTPDVTVDAAVSAGNAPNSVFKFTVPEGAGAALFEAINVNGRVQLFARKGAWPAGSSYDFASRKANAPMQQIVVRPGLKPGLTNIAGDWYFTVRNSLPSTADFTARGTLPSGGLLLGTEPIRLPGLPAFHPHGPVSGAFEVLEGERYEVQFSENLLDWQTLVITNAPAGGQINFTDPGATNSAARYYRVLQVPQ